MPTEEPTEVPTEEPSPIPTDLPTETPTIALPVVITPVPTAPWVQEYVNIAGRKIWNDQDDESGLRPEAVTVRLVRNGTVIAETTATADSGWQFSFEDLPVFDQQGRRYAYTVSEQSVPGYYARTSGYDLINTLLPQPGELPPVDQPIPNAYTEHELAQWLYLPDYDIPLYGMLLKTGLEIPAYPLIFGGIGCLAVIALIVLQRKKRKGS